MHPYCSELKRKKATIDSFRVLTVCKRQWANLNGSRNELGTLHLTCNPSTRGLSWLRSEVDLNFTISRQLGFVFCLLIDWLKPCLGNKNKPKNQKWNKIKNKERKKKEVGQEECDIMLSEWARKVSLTCIELFLLVYRQSPFWNYCLRIYQTK